MDHVCAASLPHAYGTERIQQNINNITKTYVQEEEGLVENIRYT